MEEKILRKEIIQHVSELLENPDLWELGSQGFGEVLFYTPSIRERNEDGSPSSGSLAVVCGSAFNGNGNYSIGFYGQSWITVGPSLWGCGFLLPSLRTLKFAHKFRKVRRYLNAQARALAEKEHKAQVAEDLFNTHRNLFDRKQES